MTNTRPAPAAPLQSPASPHNPPAGPAAAGGGPARRRLLRGISVNAELTAGLSILVGMALATGIVPLLSPYSVSAFVAKPLMGPSGGHLFGTDELGRDMFVRVFAALRVDLGITVATVSLSLAIGVLVGLAIGLSARPIAEALQRCVDAVLAIPYVVFVLAIVAFTKDHRMLPFVPASVGAVVLALVVGGWANYARITALQTRILAGSDSVTAVRLLGYSKTRIVLRHIVPEVISPNISLAGSHAAITTAAVASIAFLGAGVSPPTPELGAIMQAGTPLIQSAWWISIIPGLAILIMGAGFSLIADARSQIT